MVISSICQFTKHLKKNCLTHLSIQIRFVCLISKSWATVPPEVALSWLPTGIKTYLCLLPTDYPLHEGHSSGQSCHVLVHWHRDRCLFEWWSEKWFEKITSSLQCIISCRNSKQVYSYLKWQFVVWDTAYAYMQSLANQSDLFKPVSYIMHTKSVIPNFKPREVFWLLK